MAPFLGIRHELTEYDVALWEVAGKTGIAHAVAEIRRRVYSAIAQEYPALSAECMRQMEARARSPDGGEAPEISAAGGVGF